MNLAILQAEKNLGNTKENPSVGCVIIKNNCVVSAGYTSKNGRPHAEANAIYNNKNKISGGDLYVTLEPCTHIGKTGPCVNKIINSKIKRVFFSISDHDVRTKNNAKIILERKNIFTNKGLYSSKLNHFYRSYIKSKKLNLPFVTAKLAISKDFFSKNKEKKWITNEFSRGRVHLMRSNHDCIVTSAKTVIDDNPKLTCRINGLENKTPARVIIDKNLKIPENSDILKSARYYKTIVFYNREDKRKIRILKKFGNTLIKMPLTSNNGLDLKDILIKLKKFGFYRIFLEAGPCLTSSFFERKLIDDFKLFISKQKLGKKGTKKINKIMNYLKKINPIKERVNLLGDLLISYKVK